MRITTRLVVGRLTSVYPAPAKMPRLPTNSSPHENSCPGHPSLSAQTPLHGTEIAVLIDIVEYHRLRGGSPTFMEYLRADAPADADLTIERAADLPRDADPAG